MPPAPHQPDPQTEPTDPRLDALLDEALAPHDWPDAAQQRTLAAALAASAGPTAPATPAADEPSPALARVGFGLAWAVAAGVALGTAVLAISLTGSDPDPGTDQIADGTHQTDPDQAVPEAWQEELESWSVYAQAAADHEAWSDTAWVDDELELLQTQVALTSSEELWGHDDPWESLEVADLQRELDAMAYPLTPAF